MLSSVTQVGTKLVVIGEFKKVEDGHVISSANVEDVVETPEES
jgi:hypothetical protein